MKQKNLHVVSFDVPWPANYGGVIDVYYKLKALHHAGVNIHLHAFQYGRASAPELEAICSTVHYYPRKIFKNPFFSKRPYIVNTRQSPELLSALGQNDWPVLFEGLHCCYYLDHPDLEHRTKVVRMHNIEHVYYKNLAKVEKNLFKRYFFYTESNRLQHFQKKLTYAHKIASISPADHKIMNTKHGKSFYLPVFHGNDQVNIDQGRGDFVLYHGNLAVGENNEAALYLIRKVFNDLKMPLIIAGMNPSSELREAVTDHRHIRLYDNLSPEGILQLIRKAHINLLPTFQSTGIKLKLINVLFNGRFCLVNKTMVHETGLEPLCYQANTPTQIKSRLKQLFEKEFREEDILLRKDSLNDFSNSQNAGHLISAIYD